MFETTSTQQNPGPTIFPTAGVYQIRLGVTDTRGQATYSESRQVTVLVPVAPPTATILTPIGDTQIYEGESVVFEGAGSSEVGSVTYQWEDH